MREKIFEMSEVYSHTPCSCCQRLYRDILRLQPHQRINLHDLNMDGRCRNPDCCLPICSECFQRAWLTYSYKWDEENPGSYENLDDDTMEEAYRFEKKIVRCTKCTPVQPVYLVEKKLSSSSSSEEYVSPTSPSTPPTPSYYPPPMFMNITRPETSLKRKIDELLVAPESVVTKRPKFDARCPICKDKVCPEYTFECAVCKKTVCLDCTEDEVYLGTERTDVICNDCDK
jgi:hypothetical protein